MGCIDPHLIFGCEVALDSTINLAKKLETVQENFFRSVLGLSAKAATVGIFTETGTWPIRFRRMDLIIRFYLYAIQQPQDTYIYAAMQESVKLDANGYHSWFTAFKKVLRMNLPDDSIIPDLHDIEKVSAFHKDVIKKCLDQTIEQKLSDTNAKTYLLRLRKEPNTSGIGTKYKTRCLRQYLADVKNIRHRKAMTKVLCGDVPLAVERLRWSDNHRLSVPHDERLCRFGCDSVEDPEHALLHCQHAQLIQLRDDYLSAYYRSYPHGMVYTASTNPAVFLGHLFSLRSLFPTTAKYVYEAMEIFRGSELYVPPAYRRNILT
jgi:hypothetical protein